MNKILYALLLLAFVSCTPTKVASSDTGTKTDPPKTVLANDQLYRFTVSFISIGTGIDATARQQFLDFVQHFNAKNKIELVLETTNWGREGEIDYCLKLIELNEKSQAVFITETKEILKNSTRVRYKENSACQHKR